MNPIESPLDMYVRKTLSLCLLTAFLVVAGCDTSTRMQPESANETETPVQHAEDPWIEKPVLNTLLMTAHEPIEAEAERLIETLDLTNEEEATLRDIARDQQKSVMKLTAMARDDDEPSQKAVQKYNRTMNKSLESTDEKVRALLGADRYETFREWIRGWWERETQRIESFQQKRAARAKAKMQKADTYSCDVFATQYDGYTANEVALPDKYLKFANKGWDNTYSNPPYTVNLHRGDYDKYGVPVDEVGPWNIDDNYWDAANGSNPRRMWTDLPVCTPEAEAAYYNNYNGGKDQYGRTVGNPAGIDLTPEVASDIGLAYLENDVIHVIYVNLP